MQVAGHIQEVFSPDRKSPHRLTAYTSFWLYQYILMKCTDDRVTATVHFNILLQQC